VARERRRRKRVQSTAERINEVGEGRSNRAGHAADEVEAKNQWNLKMKMSRSSRWKKEHIAGNVARERRRRERVQTTGVGTRCFFNSTSFPISLLGGRENLDSGSNGRR